MTERVTEAWDCFQDPAYFGLWAVRRQSRSFEKTLHLVNADEANWLVDHLNTLAAAPPAKDDGCRRVRHKKRGTTYEVIGNAYLQTDVDCTDMTPVVVYRCDQTGSLWVRRGVEFRDGRFDDLPPLSFAPPASEGA